MKTLRKFSYLGELQFTLCASFWVQKCFEQPWGVCKHHDKVSLTGIGLQSFVKWITIHLQPQIMNLFSWWLPCLVFLLCKVVMHWIRGLRLNWVLVTCWILGRELFLINFLTNLHHTLSNVTLECNATLIGLCNLMLSLKTITNKANRLWFWFFSTPTVTHTPLTHLI